MVSSSSRQTRPIGPVMDIEECGKDYPIIARAFQREWNRKAERKTLQLFVLASNFITGLSRLMVMLL